MNAQLKQVAVFHSLFWQTQLPVAIVATFHLVRRTLTPFVELSDDENFRRVRRPFPEHPSVCVVVQTIIIIGIGKLVQIARTGGEFVKLVQRILVTSFDGTGKRLQPRVFLDDRKSVIFFLFHSFSLIKSLKIPRP